MTLPAAKPDLPPESSPTAPAEDARLSNSPDPGSRETTLPPDAEYVRTTPEFDNASVPAGLLRAHQVADGVWGRLVVRSGSLTFLFEQEPDAPLTVRAGGDVIIPSRRPHRVVLDEPVRFAVEFYRVPR